MAERSDINDCLRLVRDLFNRHQGYQTPVVVPPNCQIVFYENLVMGILAENQSNHPITAYFDSELFNILRALARLGPGMATSYNGILYSFRRGNDLMSLQGLSFVLMMKSIAGGPEVHFRLTPQ